MKIKIYKNESVGEFFFTDKNIDGVYPFKLIDEIDYTPKEVKKELRVVYVESRGNAMNSDFHQCCETDVYKEKGFKTVELPEGAKVLTKEKIEYAWNNNAIGFSGFLKELGFDD